MLKADRDQIMSNLNDDDRKQFRQFINDYREKRKASSGGRMPAWEMLDAVGGGVYEMTMTVRTAGDPNLLAPRSPRVSFSVTLRRALS